MSPFTPARPLGALSVFFLALSLLGKRGLEDPRSRGLELQKRVVVELVSVCACLSDIGTYF